MAAAVGRGEGTTGNANDLIDPQAHTRSGAAPLGCGSAGDNDGLFLSSPTSTSPNLPQEQPPLQPKQQQQRTTSLAAAATAAAAAEGDLSEQVQPTATTKVTEAAVAVTTSANETRDQKLPITAGTRRDQPSLASHNRPVSSAGLMSTGVGATAKPTPPSRPPPFSAWAPTVGAVDDAVPSRYGQQEAPSIGMATAAAVGVRERDNRQDEGQHATPITASAAVAAAASADTADTSAAALVSDSTDNTTDSSNSSSTTNNDHTKLMNRSQKPSTGARGFPSLSFPPTHTLLGEEHQQPQHQQPQLHQQNQQLQDYYRMRGREVGWRSSLTCDIDISASSSARSPEPSATDHWSEAFDADSESVSSCHTYPLAQPGLIHGIKNISSSDPRAGS